jgi:hypothetical protein
VNSACSAVLVTRCLHVLTPRVSGLRGFPHRTLDVNLRKSTTILSWPSHHLQRVTCGDHLSASKQALICRWCLSYGLVPFGTLNATWLVMTGLPHPTCRHVRFLTVARLTLHGCTLPALFHAGGTLGVSPFRAFPFRVAVRISAPDSFLTLLPHVLCALFQPKSATTCK